MEVQSVEETREGGATGAEDRRAVMTHGSTLCLQRRLLITHPMANTSFLGSHLKGRDSVSKGIHRRASACKHKYIVDYLRSTIPCLIDVDRISMRRQVLPADILNADGVCSLCVRLRSPQALS